MLFVGFTGLDGELISVNMENVKYFGVKGGAVRFRFIDDTFLPVKDDLEDVIERIADERILLEG